MFQRIFFDLLFLALAVHFAADAAGADQVEMSLGASGEVVFDELGTARRPSLKPYVRRENLANGALSAEADEDDSVEDGFVQVDVSSPQLQGALLELGEGEDSVEEGHIHKSKKKDKSPRARQPEIQTVFGEPKISPSLAKAMLSSEVHKQTDMATVAAAIRAEQDSVATASALLLIGQFTFFMMILYLLNSVDLNVRRLAWSTLHTSVAIFISMLLFMSTKSMWVLIAGHDYDGGSVGLTVSWARYVFMWIVGPVILLKAGTNEHRTEAWNSVIMWFTAFCGADAFGELLMYPYFAESLGKAFLGVCISAFIVWLQCFGACWCRYFVLGSSSAEPVTDGVSPRDRFQKWSDAYETAETTYAGFILGLLLSMWIRYAVSGKLPGPYGSPKGHSAQDTEWLLIWSCLTVFLSMIVIAAVHRLGGPDRSWNQRRFSRVVKSIMAMFSAWMVLFTFEWEFWYLTSNVGFGGEASDMTAGMALALFSSVLMFVFIYLIDFIADRAGGIAHSIRSTTIACQLIIGLCWQRVFYVAIKYAGRQFQKEERWIDILLMWCVCAIVAPAWFRFILPTFLAVRATEESAPAGDDASKEAGAGTAESKAEPKKGAVDEGLSGKRPTQPAAAAPKAEAKKDDKADDDEEF